MVAKLLLIGFSVGAMTPIASAALAPSAGAIEGTGPATNRTRLAPPPVSRPIHQNPGRTMFGFEVGEWRRYVLGPPSALLAGERSEWRIGLTRIEPRGEQRVAIFELEFDRREPFGVTRESRLTRLARGQVVVNEFGFPGLLSVHELVGDGEFVSMVYSFDGDRFQRKVTWSSGQSFDFEVPMIVHDDLRPEVPAGLFAFLSASFRAGERSPAEYDHDQQLYANPGLLSLALPWPLPAEGWEQDLFFFTPGDTLVRFPDPRWMRDLRTPATARSRHFHRNHLEIGDPLQIQVGDRVVPARKLSLLGPFRDAYVDEAGRVLLLEHEPDRLDRPHHIRLLWPSEYSTR